MNAASYSIYGSISEQGALSHYIMIIHRTKTAKSTYIIYNSRLFVCHPLEYVYVSGLDGNSVLPMQLICYLFDLYGSILGVPDFTTR